MNPLTERAAMGLARLYGKEIEHQKYETPAQAVCENISTIPDNVLAFAVENSGLPKETIVKAWRSVWISNNHIFREPQN